MTKHLFAEDYGYVSSGRWCELCDDEFLVMMDKPDGQKYTRRADDGTRGVWRKVRRGLCAWCYDTHWRRGELELVALLPEN